jgi:hypothetical protein
MNNKIIMRKSFEVSAVAPAMNGTTIDKRLNTMSELFKFVDLMQKKTKINDIIGRCL